MQPGGERVGINATAINHAIVAVETSEETWGLRSIVVVARGDLESAASLPSPTMPKRLPFLHRRALERSFGGVHA